MQLHEVQRVDAKVGTAAVRPAPEGLQRVGVGHVRVGPPAHLRRDRQPRAADLAQQRAEQPLAAAVAVDVGGVEEGDPLVHRRPEHGHRRVVVDQAPVPAQLPAAEPDHTDLSGGPAQRPCLHR